MITLKSKDVIFTELTPGLAWIFYRLETFHRLKMASQPDNLVITSLTDSIHGTNSKHYINLALDLRSHNFSSLEEKQNFRSKLELFLGPKFTVLLEDIGSENEHFHIQVKKGITYP